MGILDGTVGKFVGWVEATFLAETQQSRLKPLSFARGLDPTYTQARLLAVALAFATLLPTTVHADAPFRAFLESLRPEAEALGVSKATFDTAIQGLEPDLSLPDLEIPGRPPPADANRGQTEFTKSAKDYIDQAYLGRLAADGRVFFAKHKVVLENIEKTTGVDRYILVAIWGRETAFGTYKLPHDAIRVLATEAYLGRRKDMFRIEFLYGLKMLQDGIPRSLMRSSWAGAVGLTQFMPSEYYKHAADGDGDGKADIFNSVPDALASAAMQLKDKGWVKGVPWGFEVRIPAAGDCSVEGPPGSQTMAQWSQLGFQRTGGRTDRKSVV